MTNSRKRSNAPADSVERLRKQASKKMSRAIRAIRSVGQLARLNPAPWQIQAIMETFHTETSNVLAVLRAGRATHVEFELPAKATGTHKKAANQ